MQAHWHDLKPAPAPRDREKQITKRSTFFFKLRKVLNYNNPQRYGTFCQLEFGRVLNFQYFSRVQFPFHFQFGESFEFTIFLASVALQTFATSSARAHTCHQMEPNDSLENIDFWEQQHMTHFLYLLDSRKGCKIFILIHFWHNIYTNMNTI